MCFSAEASFTSAGVLAVIGGLTYRESQKEDRTKKLYYLAIIPLMFALQQFFEGIVWMTMPPDSDYILLNKVAKYGFLFFAGLFWPIWIPYTLYTIEENCHRKKLIFWTLCIGGMIAIAASLSMFILGNDVLVISHNIAYPLPLSAQEYSLSPFFKIIYALILGLYVFVTIGSSFISTVRYVWIFGFLTLIGFITAQLLYTHAFGSIWCFFAALISSISYFIVKKAQSPLP